MTISDKLQLKRRKQEQLIELAAFTVAIFVVSVYLGAHLLAAHLLGRLP